MICATEPNEELKEDLGVFELPDDENEELLTVNLTPKNATAAGRKKSKSFRFQFSGQDPAKNSQTTL